MKSRQQLIIRWSFIVMAVFLFAGIISVGTIPLSAQQTSGGNTGGGDTTTGGGDTTTGGGDTGGAGGDTGGGAAGGEAAAAENDRPGGGVFVNPQGVLTRYTAMDTGRLTNQQLLAAQASYQLADDVSEKSPLRCISLNRLEKAIKESGGVITEDMRYLAGIQRITHVFYFSESKDIVVAGPAEGWFPGPENAMIGVSTLQPVCELQDLVVALRAYPPNGNAERIVGCSIDPTAEGNVRLRQFVAQSRNLNPRVFSRGVRQSIGMQTIRIDGISAKTNAAKMMVAADYRMKLIGLGLDEKPYARMQTFIEHTVPNASNAAFRWFFVPDYESVMLTEDRTGLELVGEGVKLVGENEIVSSTGERSTVEGRLDRGSSAYTRSFTQYYDQIAKNALVFAQLRNWIDMLICAAHIQKENFYDQSGWSMEFFGSEKQYPLELFTAPEEVEPVVGVKTIRRTVLAPVGGGVTVNAHRALDKERVQLDKEGKVTEKQKQVSLYLLEDRWWWDVK